MKAFSLSLVQPPSKILDRKWKEKEAAIHRRKLSEVKSNIRQHQRLSKNLPDPSKKNQNKAVMMERKLFLPF